MKIGIIGLGYWGKNIFNVLSKTDHELILCDPFLTNMDPYSGYSFREDYRLLNCDVVFVITPTSTHHEVCKYFLSEGTSVFCEKPLCLSVEEVEDLYKTAENNQCYLMTDWIFSFNDELNFIKSEFESGEFGGIKSAFCERLNLGPVRTDTNARWDLSSHDVSIITYLFNEMPHRVCWLDTRRNPSSQLCDTSIGVITYSNFYASIHSSWEYEKKRSRKLTFEFDHCVVEWDDAERTVKRDGIIIAKELSDTSPLEYSISSFLSIESMLYRFQKELTYKTTLILCRSSLTI